MYRYEKRPLHTKKDHTYDNTTCTQQKTYTYQKTTADSGNVLRPHHRYGPVNYPKKKTFISVKRPTKISFGGKRSTKETCKRDLQKRPAKTPPKGK